MARLSSQANVASRKAATASYIGAGVAPGGGGGVVPGLPAFAYQAETEALSAARTADGSPMNAGEKFDLDRMFVRLKAAGIPMSWFKGIWCGGADTEAKALYNLVNPSQKLTKVGAGVFTPGEGFSAPAATDAWDTGVSYADLPQNDVFMGVQTDRRAPTSGDGADIGVLTGASSGLAIAARTSSTSAASIRVMGAGVGSAGLGGSAPWDGRGFHAVARVNATEFRVYKHSAVRVVVSNASASLSLGNIFIGRANGATALTGRKVNFAVIGTSGQAITDYQMSEIYGALATYYEAQRHGSPERYQPAVAPAAVSADVVIYGTTASGLVAAYELRRQGKTVVVVGGWRDTPANLGGMSGGGLAYVDFQSKTNLKGLPRDIITRANLIAGLTDDDTVYATQDMRKALLEYLTPAKGGQAVPIYYSTGIKAVAKTGARLTSMTTADGRTFSGKYFYDHSYEGDLLVLSGVSFVTGREAAGAGNEAFNGYRGLLTAAGSNEHQFRKGTTFHNLDPYLVPGNAGSGLLFNVSPLPAKTNGQADTETQSYNFRLAIGTSLALGSAMSATPPAGYDKVKYEALLRWLAIEPTLTMEDIFNLDNVRSQVIDVNSDGGIGSDFWGKASEYVAATTYAQREAVWQDHANWIKGLWYVLQYEADSRVPSALRTAALIYAWAGNHFYDRHPNDTNHFSPQLYVREFRRLAGPLVWNGNDVAATDGTTPRSTNTIGLASYPMDSHHVRAYADPNGGTPRIWNEGNFFIDGSNGANNISPLPYEIITPKKTECENLLVGFSISSTHTAFGSIRMEETVKLMGQSGAMAIAIALENGDLAVQDVSYTALRARILAAPDASPQVLPQVN